MMPAVDVEFVTVVFRVYIDGMAIRAARQRVERKRNAVDVHYRLWVEPGRTVTVEYVEFKPKGLYKPDIWFFLAKGGDVDIWDYDYDPALLPKKYTFKMPNTRVKVALGAQVKLSIREKYLLTVYVWLEPPTLQEEKPSEKVPEKAEGASIARMVAVLGGALAVMVVSLSVLARRRR